MKTEALAAHQPSPPALATRILSPRGRITPVLCVGLAIIVIWYLGVFWLNGPMATEALDRTGTGWGWMEWVRQCLNMRRPILPTPEQVLVELWNSLFNQSLTSPRNLLFHTAVTAQAALLGLAMGVVFGIILAAGIVHVPRLEHSLLPWVIASQTIPILAIAPMIVVILGNAGLTGTLPKAVICMYLCFFPITVGMVKGLRSADPLWIDLMRTYSAGGWASFVKLRLPASLPFLFASLKVSVAISVVGAIVGELPTGGQAGLGARLLSGSYYGQTVQIWAALIMASVLSLALIGLVRLLEVLLAGQQAAAPARGAR